MHKNINQQKSLPSLPKPLTLIKNMGLAMCILDREMRLVWMNNVFENLFGSSEKNLGQHCFKLFHHRDEICKGCHIKIAFQTGKVTGAEVFNFNIDGQKHYFEVTASPIKDAQGNIKQVLVVAQDVTQKRHEKENIYHLLTNSNYICKSLFLANKRLNKNVCHLKNIYKDTTRLNRTLKERYQNKLKELDFTKEGLKEVYDVSRIISSGDDVRRILESVARLTCKVMHADACSLRILDDTKNMLLPEISFGLDKDNFLKPLNIGQGIAGRSFEAGKPLAIADLKQDLAIDNVETLKRQRLHSALSMPTIYNGKPIGALTIYTKDRHTFNSDEIKLSMTFAVQMALILEETKLCHDAHINYFDTIHSLVLAMEARDPYTRGHSDRVTRYALQIARKLKLSSQDLETLRYAGLLHDVGKIGISDLILNKPGKLSPAERTVIQLHPEKGVEMLEPLKFLEAGLPLVRHHHERFDGKGYPDGLKDMRIPLMARILACADAFDAMTSERPYRINKMSVIEAIREIKKNCGKQFDPEVASVFIQILKLDLSR